MIVGLTLSQFTLLHVIISLVAIASGLLILITRKDTPAGTNLFLVTTALTSLTGFLFPFQGLTPGIIIGVISTVVLAVAVTARFGFQMSSSWRNIYLISATIALYLNIFVLVAQSFQKIPALHALAPTQSEPAFGITQLIVLITFVVLGRRLTSRNKQDQVSGVTVAGVPTT